MQATRQQLQTLDRLAVTEHHMHSLQLMENAGGGAAAWIIKNRPAAQAVILCGPGNNGGDGCVIARHLEFAGFTVTVVLVTDEEKLQGDALHNFLIIKTIPEIRILPWSSQAGLKSLVDSLGERDTLIDGLLGTGARLPVRTQLRQALTTVEDSCAYRVALDIPTGMDADTGLVDQVCFRADATLTFAARKVGFQALSAQPFLGHVEVIPIGVPRSLLDKVLHHSSD